MNQTNVQWRNHLFARLPINVWNIWEQAVESVYLSADDVVSEAGVMPLHVYFPHSAIISLTHLLEAGDSIEVAMIGSEGMVGVSVFLGNVSTSTRAIVLRSGLAYRLDASFIRHAFDSCVHAKQIMLRYTQSLLSQFSQVGACTQHHSLEQRMCRWLSFYLDRSDDMYVQCTQEKLSYALGVRRERIAQIARNFHELGLMSYSRGTIYVHNREGILSRACECYDVINCEYRRLNLSHFS
jgi:CRP-like cAMP-binding protein